MTLQQLTQTLRNSPDSISFKDVMTVINNSYDYQATEFSNGLSETAVINKAGSNEGSCKIFAFAKLNQLSEEQTLACFGDFYRQDVLQHPGNDDHQNIRNFMQDGWAGVTFSGVALSHKGE